MSEAPPEEVQRQLRRAARRLRELAGAARDGLLLDTRTLVNNLLREADLLEAMARPRAEVPEDLPTLRPGAAALRPRREE